MVLDFFLLGNDLLLVCVSDVLNDLLFSVMENLESVVV